MAHGQLEAVVRLRSRIVDTVMINLITVTTVWGIIYESRAQVVGQWVRSVLGV